MPVVIPAGFAQMTMRMTLSGGQQTAENVFGVNFTEASAFQEVADFWANTLMDLVSSVWTFTHASARVQEGVVWEAAYNAPGLETASAVPPNVSLLWRKITDSPGRRNKGRMYIPGIPEANVDGLGNLTAGMITSWNTVGTQFLTAIAGAPSGGFGTMVILHEQTVPQPPPTTVDQLATQTLVATQRRRLRG